MKTLPAFVLCAVGGVAALAQSGQQPLDPNLFIEQLVGGLNRPTSMIFVGPDDILILQKDDGRVRRVTGGVLQPGAVLDLHVDSFKEQGGLALARDPDFLNNGYVYVYYTESSTGADTSLPNSMVAPLGNRVYRYRWNGATLVEPLLVLDLQANTGNHNGGVLVFGPDDLLYLIFGDQVKNGKLQNNPTGAEPDDTSVIFRVRPDGSAPPDNPFHDPADPGNPMNRYFVYGVRNSFGMAFDPLSGDLWFTDNGPTAYDELNRAVAGMNGGHSKIWGPDERDPQGVGDLWQHPGAVYVDPQLSWLGSMAPTSVAFLDTPKLGCDYLHDMLVGTYNCRLIYRMELNAARDSLALTDPALADRVVDNAADKCAQEQDEILFAVGPPTNSDQTTDIEVGPDGLVYLLSYSHHTLRRIVPVEGAWPDADGDDVDDACDCDVTDPGSYGLPIEVPRIRPAGTGPTTLGWDGQSARSGAGTTYAVVSGEIAELHADGGFASSCTLTSGSTVPATTDVRPLASGSGYYYLVRAENSCGSGGFGAGSITPDPREDLDAVLPTACP